MGIKTFLSGSLLLLLGMAVHPQKSPTYDLSQDPFFEKTRLIMSAEEIKIYKHLPDDQARKDFIAEFWRLRDPDPDTEENEAEVEFKKRIEYANANFREVPTPGHGWDTDRGRVLLILGFPDQVFKERDINPFDSPVREIPNTAQREVWVYQFYDYTLTLMFLDRNGTGKFQLEDPDPSYFQTVERMKFFVDQSSEVRKHRFTFDARYRKGKLEITFPTKSVNWQSAEGQMRAAFTVSVGVYRDYVKGAPLAEKVEIRRPEQELLGKKKVSVEVALPLAGKGQYYLDVVVREEFTSARWRQMISTRLK